MQNNIPVETQTEIIKSMPDAECYPYPFYTPTAKTYIKYGFDVFGNKLTHIQMAKKLRFKKDHSGLFWMFRGYMEIQSGVL